MKILIINPNSDQEMTRTIEAAAKMFAAGEFDVVCKPTPEAPPFIETYEDQAKAAPGMIRLLKESHDDYDAFVIACHSDPNLDLMKELSWKPVVGVGEASMKIATMLGHRFSVIATDFHSIPNKEALIEKYHLQAQLASVRALAKSLREKSQEEQYFLTAKAAIEEDGAEVIVLGCAGLAGLAKRLQEKLGVPVLDGVVCALIIASGLAKYKAGTSKIRRYNPEY